MPERAMNQPWIPSVQPTNGSGFFLSEGDGRETTFIRTVFW